MSRDRWFLRSATEVVDRLRAQADAMVDTLRALEAWTAGEDAAAGRVGEHHAQVVARGQDLLRTVGRALVAPLDRDDLYELSERIQRVAHGAETIVRAATTLRWRPDPPALALAQGIRAAGDDLGDAFGRVGDDPTGAIELADGAASELDALVDDYCAALRAATDTGSSRDALVAMEMYRWYEDTSRFLAHVAHRLGSSLLKQS